MARYLLPPSVLMERGATVSATSERGSAIRRAPQPDDANVGALNLTARHVLREVTPEALTFEVEGGGNPEGYKPGGPTVSNGCRVRWWPSDESSTTARSWVDHPFTRYTDCANPGEDYGPLSSIRQSQTGRVGFVAVDDNGGTLRLRFAYKASRFADWSHVTITDNASATEQLSTHDQRCGLIITDKGRWICYASTTSPYATSSNSQAAWYSDDDGNTWTVLNDACMQGVTDCSAEWVDGMVVIVAGSRAYYSTSEGVAFTPAGSASGTYSNCSTVAYGASVLVFADDGSSIYMANITPGGRLDDDAIWTEVFGTNYGQRVVWLDDQGVLWGLGLTDNTSARAALYASIDGGLSWESGMFLNPASTQAFGLSDGTLSPAQTIEHLTAGMMGATAIVVGVSDVSTSGSSGADGQTQCIYMGGWDVALSEEGYGEYHGEPYQFHVWPITTPTNQNWSATNVGSGSTTTIAGGKINMVATGSDNTDFRAPSAWRTAMGAGGATQLGARLRLVVNVNSGGSVVASRAYVRLQLDTPTGAFWLVLRFSSTQIRAIDNSGTLATASLIGAMSSPVELLVKMNKADSSGSSCTANVLYRAQSSGDDGAWQQLIVGVSINHDTGSSGDDLRFGGTVGGAVDWDLQWLALATDHYGLEVGSGARGRALSNAAPMYAYKGVAVGAYGTSGVEGDTYDLTEVAAFPASAVWGSDSPSEQCQSTDDTALWRVVFDLGASDELWGDIVAAFGTNVAEFKVMANATNSWGSPSRSVTVDSSIRSESLDGTGAGWATLDIVGDEMTPHEFASKPGQRYMVAFSGTGNAYEITDNTDTTLIVKGQDLSSESGTATVYMSAGWGDIDLDEMRYLAFEVAANEPNPDGYFSLGGLVPSQKVSMNAGDGSDVKYGYSRGTRIPVQVEEAADGYQAATVIGGPQEVLMLPMLESVQALRDWSHEVVSLLRYMDGPGSLVVFIGDSSVSHFHRNGGLYRVQGTEFTETHIYGNDSEQRWRAPTIRLREVT